MSSPNTAPDPAVGMEEAEQQPDHRRLARPVRAEEAEDLALVDLDREFLEGPDLGRRTTAREVDRARAVAVSLREPGRDDRLHPRQGYTDVPQPRCAWSTGVTREGGCGWGSRSRSRWCQRVMMNWSIATGRPLPMTSI